MCNIRLIINLVPLCKPIPVAYAFVGQYQPHLVCGRKNNLVKAQQYLKGLFHEGKSNIERMHERIPDSDYQQMHQ